MNDDYSAMKAFIIYNDMTSALRVINSLRSVGHHAETRVEWKINLWRTNMLRFRSLAEEALAEGADADLVVLTGGGAISLRPWLKEWLERWSQSRLIENAALALVQDKSSAAYSMIRASELSEFARSHQLNFITNDPEIEKAEAATSLAFRVNQHHDSTRPLYALPLQSSAPSEKKGVSSVL